MNRQWMYILALVCAALLLCPSAAFATNAGQLISQTNDQLNTAVAQAHFLTETSPQQALTDFANEAPAFEAALQRAITGFQNAARATKNSTLRGYANRFAKATRGMATAVVGMVNSLAAKDADGLQTATGDLDSSVNDYTSAADAYNTFVEGDASSQPTPPPVWNFLFFIVIGAGLLAVSLATWARTKVPEGDSLAAELKKQRGDLALGSVLPLAGSVSAYIWYRVMERHGGYYPLLYLPILVGFIGLALLFIRYRRALKASTRMAGSPVGPVGAGALPAEDPAEPE